MVMTIKEQDHNRLGILGNTSEAGGATCLVETGRDLHCKSVDWFSAVAASMRARNTSACESGLSFSKVREKNDVHSKHWGRRTLR